MPGLKNKLEDYLKIVNIRMKYELARGKQIEFEFLKKNFPHMIGLHKLKDIPLIKRFNDINDKMVNTKYLITKIRKENLTEEDLKNSVYYHSIEERYEKFTSENLLSMTYTDVVIDFDVKLLKNSKLWNTQYIFYEKKDKGYNQLCVAQDVKDNYYAETFFYEPSDDYIKGQTYEKIVKVQMLDAKGNLYLEDEFMKSA